MEKMEQLNLYSEWSIYFSQTKTFGLIKEQIVILVLLCC